jgi:hypothetical protein
LLNARLKDLTQVVAAVVACAWRASMEHVV